MEALREIFHYADVTSYGSFSVITSLEFLQHHFSEMSHEDSCDPHLHQTVEQPTLQYLTRSVRRRVASFKSAWGKLLLIRLGMARPNSGRMTGYSEALGCHPCRPTVAVGSTMSGPRQLVYRKLLFREAITFDARSARRACALTVPASAQPHLACLPPLVAGSRQDLWPLR
jgi:hypothetical protein